MSPGSLPILKELKSPKRIPKMIKNKPIIKKRKEKDFNI
jgi:hypothetical protein